MTISEQDRLDLRQALERALGNERLANIAMEAMPPVDYAQLATKADLEAFRLATKADLEAFRLATETRFDAMPSSEARSPSFGGRSKPIWPTASVS